MFRWLTTIRVIFSITNLWLGTQFLYIPITRVGIYAKDAFNLDPTGVSYIMGILFLIAGITLMFDPQGWRLVAAMLPFVIYNVVTALVVFQPGTSVTSGGAVISLGIMALAVAYIGLSSYSRVYVRER